MFACRQAGCSRTGWFSLLGRSRFSGAALGVKNRYAS